MSLKTNTFNAEAQRTQSKQVRVKKKNFVYLLSLRLSAYSAPLW